jgi:hypothetical protein
MIVARHERAALQLAALCPGDPYETRSAEPIEEVETGRDRLVAVRSRVMASRRRWKPPRYARCEAGAASAHEWQKPLDVLAHAWNRLLILVGWWR